MISFIERLPEERGILANGRQAVWPATWVGLLLLAGCHKAPPPAAMPTPEITVAKPLAKKIVEHAEYTGRMAAIENVSVRPRVSGYITKIPFKEGSVVKKDDLLFVIDPRPYQAALEQTQGQLKQAQAEYDTAASARNQSDAAVATAQAALDAAKLNLEFTQVKSPIDGRVSRYDVTIGNLVANDTTVLTNIVSVDPIYAYADVDERTVLNYQKLEAEGKVKDARDSPVQVAVQVAGEPGFPHKGTIDFVDNQINAATGTLSIRGKFPNADGNLLPGMFVRMQLPVSGEMDALLITDRAVASDQGQKFVYVFADGKVDQRPVALGPVVDGLRVVTGGLKPDDEVVIIGLMKVRPGSPAKAGQGKMEQFASDQLALKTTVGSK